MILKIKSKIAIFLLMIYMLHLSSIAVANAQEKIESCSVDNLVFTGCLPSVCIEETPFGNVKRQIIGYDKDNQFCLYKERSEGIGGINCKYESQDLAKIQSIIHKKIQMKSDDTIALSEQEYMTINALNEKYCVFLDDIEAFSDPIIEPSTKREDEKKTADTSDAKRDVEKEKVAKMKTKKSNLVSLMFSEAEFDLIQKAVNAYFSGGKLDVSGNNNQGQIRSFFLKSLIYFSEDKWSLWIENSIKTEKINNDFNASGLEVIDVSVDSAIISWQTPSLDKISPEWKTILKFNDVENLYQHENYYITVQSVAESIYEVTFKLKPNQSFNVNSMQIIEGKINK